MREEKNISTKKNREEKSRKTIAKERILIRV